MTDSPLPQAGAGASLTSAALSDAVHENTYALLRAMAAVPGGTVREGKAFCCHSAPLPNPMFRGAWRARLREQDVDAAIDEAAAWFASRGERDFFWWTDARTQPADMNERLLQHGFEGVVEPGMAADLHHLAPARPAPQGLEIIQARDPKMIAAWGQVFATSFGEPPSSGLAWEEATLHFLAQGSCPWTLYLGCLDGKPVATNLLFNGAVVAGIYAVGTLPEARRMGIGEAITLRPLLDARAEGYRYGTLFASRMGKPVYQKMGFREVGNPIGIFYASIK